MSSYVWRALCNLWPCLEEIAFKFDCKPVQVLQVFKEPDILIADDDDVSRLKPGTVLEVNIKKVAARPALSGPPL